MDRTQREAYIEWCISRLRRRGLRVIGLEHGGSQVTPVSLGSGEREIHIDVASGLQNVGGGLQGMASGLENVASGLESVASGLQDMASALRAALLPRAAGQHEPLVRKLL